MTSSDPNFNILSPGKLHLAKVLEYCLKNKIHFFEMGRGSEPYKLEWCNEQKSLNGWSKYGVSLPSHIKKYCYKNLIPSMKAVKIFLSN